MQTLTWYARRLRAMSLDEIVWRGRSAVRDRCDRYRIARRLVPGPLPGTPLYPDGAAVSRLCPLPVGAWRDVPAGDPAAGWRDRLVERAEAIRAHRFSFFDLECVDVGHPVDWNRDHASGAAAPLSFAAGIDYRDARVTGDAKVVWEPNRHHHLVVLARAWRATGRHEFAAAVAEQLESWLDQSPFGFGMNWRSPLELAVRVINWVWALDLIAEAGALPPALEQRLLHAIRLHVWDIARKYSRGSSANNHLIGEACGVFVATSYFHQLPGAGDLRRRSQAILAREIVAQTYPSGATREQAFGYHLFVLQFFLYAEVVARRSGSGFGEAYRERLQRMLAFAAAMAEGGEPPCFGDADDGYVLDLGNRVRDVRALRAVGAMLVGADRCGAAAARDTESVRWLFPREEIDRAAGEPPCAHVAPPLLRSRAFEDAGCYLLQSGEAGSGVSVLFDCGELGFTALAAHGHADALSFTLRAYGADVFVDPGTYDYFTYPDWREYFRSTRAHNTVVVDDQDQSVLLGSFLWGRRAAARCLAWEPREEGGSVRGEHDGYARLPDPVICRRQLTLDGAARTLTIDDEIATAGPHRVMLCFHLAAGCEARQDESAVRIGFGAGTAVLRLDGRLGVHLVRGGSPHEGGWVSSGYHRKVEAWTIRAATTIEGTTTLRSRIEWWPRAT